jgi:hypothetical protein
MSCDWARPNLTLYLYEDLPPEAREKLERHLDTCEACVAELRALRDFHDLMSAAPRPELTPNLLAASRLRLDEAIDKAQLQPGFRSWLRQMQFSPAWAALTLAAFLLGAGTASRMGSSPPASPENRPAAQEASLAGVRSISRQPETGQVEITYETMVPQKMQGALGDEHIQELLLFAARNTANSGIRMDSVDLLTRNPQHRQVRETLKTALLYDSNPGVRLKALEAIGPLVKEDISVRDTVLEALMDDSNPGVRAEAIRYLQPVRVDGSVREALQRLSREDESPFIRRQSRGILASLPEMD